MTDKIRYINEDGTVDEKSIYRDAWRIADPGASNPVAVAGTLAAASSAMLREVGTSGVKRHPALKVMAGQLASLYRVDSVGAEIEDYNFVKTVFDVLENGGHYAEAIKAAKEVTNRG
ncbi:MAG TPA: hypothetical protein VGI56_11940 [Galbitalea sp.]|jgi:uncharacterized membrane protein